MSNTDTDTNTNTAMQLATQSNALMQSIQHLPLEQQKEILEAEKRLAIISLPQTQSKDLIGKRLNILDALFSTMPDEKKQGELKQVVVFIVQEVDTDTLHAVTKSSNFFNDAYVSKFDAWRSVGGTVISNMTFETDSRYQMAGNPAIVIRPYKETATAKGK